MTKKENEKEKKSRRVGRRPFRFNLDLKRGVGNGTFLQCYGIADWSVWTSSHHITSHYHDIGGGLIGLLAQRL
jgi:hypothetical protein